MLALSSISNSLLLITDLTIIAHLRRNFLKWNNVVHTPTIVSVRFTKQYTGCNKETTDHILCKKVPDCNDYL